MRHLLQGHPAGAGPRGDGVGAPAEEEVGQPKGEVPGRWSAKAFTRVLPYGRHDADGRKGCFALCH